jgi:uncharacterized protein YfkK (UPF0435 family)
MFKVMTLENYDRFSADFLVMFYNLVKTKENMTQEEIKGLKLPYFEWTDDNEHRIGYSFNGKDMVYDEKSQQELKDIYEDNKN